MPLPDSAVVAHIAARASPEVQINEAIDVYGWGAVYGYNAVTSSALTWGYYGGRWGGFSVAGGTLALTNAAANYIVALRSSGAISVSTATTNWDNALSYARVYKVTTAGSVVTAIEDHRAGVQGAHGAHPASAGRRSLALMASAITPSVAGGCAAVASVASGANLPDINHFGFDTTIEEYAQCSFAMPKSWDEGTVTFKPIWSHAATTVNFGVMWGLQGIAVSDNEAIGTAYGTQQNSLDTGGITDRLYIGPESAAITIAGTPAPEDVVFFRIRRVTADAGDTLGIDARLHGIILYFNTNAENDA